MDAYVGDHSHPHDHSHDHHHEPDGIGRRSVLIGAGGLLALAAAPDTAHAATTTTAVDGTASPQIGASRASRITQGTSLVHGDMHNHTVMSDGDGDPEQAFLSMREAGLDVAALTDHATLFGINGISWSEWNRTGELAAAADDPGQYTAIRGFEWSHPLLGHINVYSTDSFVDLLGASSMSRLYEWLADHDGIATFNHPGRESGRFDDFEFRQPGFDQMVGLELFNRREDYLFKNWSSDGSPLNACLNAGWRVGLTGVTDEHGTDWGFPEGKGRTGLWVTENTRAAVYEALRSRRTFATRASGLRVDATADGVRMGGQIPLGAGDVAFEVDVDRPDWNGKPLAVQVLRPGTDVPEVVDVIEFEVGDVAAFTVPLNVDDGDWVVLRIADPAGTNDSPGPDGHPCNDLGIAYTSPWWLGGV